MTRKTADEKKLEAFVHAAGEAFADALGGTYERGEDPDEPGGFVHTPDYAAIPVVAHWHANYGHLGVGGVRYGFTRATTGTDLVASLQRKPSSWQNFLAAIAEYALPAEPEPAAEPVEAL